MGGWIANRFAGGHHQRFWTGFEPHEASLVNVDTPPPPPPDHPLNPPFSMKGIHPESFMEYMFVFFWLFFFFYI